MPGPRIHHRGQPQLIDAVQPLKKRVLYNPVEYAAWYLDKPENRVVDDFNLAHLLH
jgi:hypothetical protein